MGLIKRTLKFTAGGVTGAAVGAVAALLLAPDNGPEFQRRLRDRLRDAKAAGADAKAEKENELIRRFRVGVNDDRALTAAEERARVERNDAMKALGLGLNAPGAIAAHDPSKQ